MTANPNAGVTPNCSAGDRPGNSNIRVSIIVPCRNERDYILPCLDNLLGQVGVDGEFEIIVAVGMSDDGTRELVSRVAVRDQRVLLLDNPGRTVSRGLNSAIRRSRGEFVVRADAHTEYAPDYVRACLSELQRTGAWNVGGPARTRSRSYVQRANAAAYQSFFSVGGARFHDPDFEGWVDTVTYGCWRRQTLIDLGLFDEDLVRNQDDEFNLRTVAAGGSIWQSPSIRSWYYPRDSIKKVFRQYFQYGYWKYWVIQKHGRAASLRQLVPITALVTGVSLALLSVFVVQARTLLALLLGAYGVTSILYSAGAAIKAREAALAIVMPVVFAAYHVGYALGFAKGMIAFHWRRVSVHDSGLSR